MYIWTRFNGIIIHIIIAGYSCFTTGCVVGLYSYKISYKPMGKVLVTLYIQYDGGNPYKSFYTACTGPISVHSYMYVSCCICRAIFYRFVLRKQVAKNQQHASMC